MANNSKADFKIENGVLKECRTGKYSLILPEGIVQIGESYKFNQGLTVFNEKNFMLKELIIPEGVKSIENNAFNHSRLTRITFPESLEKIGANAFLKGYNYQTFDSDDALRTLRFPKNLKSIGESAFSYCGLDYAFVSENTAVGCDAFPEDCRVFVEKNDGNITETADLSFMNLEDAAEPDEDNRYVKVTGVKNKALETYDLSPLTEDDKTIQCSEICFYAFEGCTRMKTVIIPETVENIEDDAFAGSSLILAKVHESLRYLIEDYNPFPEGCEIEYFE